MEAISKQLTFLNEKVAEKDEKLEELLDRLEKESEESMAQKLQKRVDDLIIEKGRLNDRSIELEKYLQGTQPLTVVR